MPIDPNEAPKGTIAVEHAGDKCPGKICFFYGKKQCAYQTCHCDDRKDKTNCYFINKPQPTETKTMEDEYETLTADIPENVATIFRWMKEGCVERNADEAFVLTNRGTIIFGWQYRRKKPQTDVLLTDPGDISRGILEGSVECMQGTAWLHATVHDTNFIATKLELGAKYRPKPGCKLVGSPDVMETRT